MISITPLAGIGEIVPGDDLAGMLADAILAGSSLVPPGSVLVVTQKVVSKSEGRFVDLDAVSPGEEARSLAGIVRKDAAFVEVVLQESVAVLRAVPNVLITRHRLGFVMANAGIDRSNIGPGTENRVLLLPADPDASARRIHDRLAARFAAPIPVVISDSFGRPWRNGVVNVAVGAAGLVSLSDRRGLPDRDGRALEVTQIAQADLIASAAGLAAGEGSEGIAAVLVSGLNLGDGDLPASVLVRPLEEDLFQ